MTDQSTSEFAALFDAVSDSEEVLKLPLGQIKSRKQSRKRFRNLDGLGKTLLRQQEQPIVVAPMEEDGKYVIQKGERRWRAASLVGMTTLDAIVRPWAKTKVEATYGELVENIQRDGYAPLELAESLQDLADDGQTQQDIADGLGKSKSWVNSYLALNKVHADILILGDDDVITDKDSLFKLGQIYNLDKSHALQMAEIARTDGLTRKQINDTLQMLKTREQREEGDSSSVSVNDSQNEAEPKEEINTTTAGGEAQQKTVALVSDSDSKAPQAATANPQSQKKSDAGFRVEDSKFKKAIKITVSHNGQDAELVLDGGPVEEGVVLIKTVDGILSVPGHETSIVSVAHG
jgi:ParB family chromosome partitioning protein